MHFFFFLKTNKRDSLNHDASIVDVVVGLKKVLLHSRLRERKKPQNHAVARRRVSGSNCSFGSNFQHPMQKKRNSRKIRTPPEEVFGQASQSSYLCQAWDRQHCSRVLRKVYVVTVYAAAAYAWGEKWNKISPRNRERKDFFLSSFQFITFSDFTLL